MQLTLTGHHVDITAPLKGYVEKKLDRIVRQAGGAGSARDWLQGVHPASAHGTSVLLTFDDGDASNHRLAVPMLVDRGMRADFFVNPSTVGSAGFVGWGELRDMSDAGMSIQSHGYDHRYLTHLTTTALRDSLQAARIEIEDRVGMPVRLLAPPGGRMPAGLAGIARECGYSHVLASRPGRIVRSAEAIALPRMAVTAGTTGAVFARWIRGDRGALAIHAMRYATLRMAKRLLGDAHYEQARAFALAARGPRT